MKRFDIEYTDEDGTPRKMKNLEENAARQFVDNFMKREIEFHVYPEE